MNTDFKAAVLIALWMIAMYKTGYEEEAAKAPVFTKYQYLDTLPPDMVHADTLLVINAAYLNEKMPSCSGTDGDIMELLNETTVPLQGNKYFAPGDSILPYDDYFFMDGCKDTLIVKDADAANEIMNNIERNFPDRGKKNVYLNLIKKCCYDNN